MIFLQLLKYHHSLDRAVRPLTGQFGHEVESLGPLKRHFFNHCLKPVDIVPDGYQATSSDVIIEF